MKLIKADFDRRIEIPGVPGPVQRPVDIDQSQTGFTNLRTLRIYRFEPGSTIDGHAEEDEVFVVVLAGSVDIELNDGDPADGWRPYTLSAQGGACVAYLPPHAAYRLTPRTNADVAYARATPESGRPSKVFERSSHKGLTAGDNPANRTIDDVKTASPECPREAFLIEETTYAQLLRLRLVRINAMEHDVVFSPIHDDESLCEALVHIRIEPAMALESWDTAAIAPGERPAMRIEKGSTALVLTIFAVDSIS